MVNRKAINVKGSSGSSSQHRRKPTANWLQQMQIADCRLVNEELPEEEALLPQTRPSLKAQTYRHVEVNSRKYLRNEGPHIRHKSDIFPMTNDIIHNQQAEQTFLTTPTQQKQLKGVEEEDGTVEATPFFAKQSTPTKNDTNKFECLSVLESFKQMSNFSQLDKPIILKRTQTKVKSSQGGDKENNYTRKLPRG